MPLVTAPEEVEEIYTEARQNAPVSHISAIHRLEVWAEAVSQQVVKYCRLLGYEYLAK